MKRVAKAKFVPGQGRAWGEGGDGEGVGIVGMVSVFCPLGRVEQLLGSIRFQCNFRIDLYIDTSNSTLSMLNVSFL